MSTIELTRGDDRDLYLVAGVNLSGALGVWFLAKYRSTDLDADAVFAKTIGAGITITSAAAGLATVSIVAADWAKYAGSAPLVWGIQVQNSAGKVSEPLKGTITVKQDVVRDGQG